MIAHAAAPVWRRVVARLIDLLVCVPLTFVVVVPVAVLCLPLFYFLGNDAAGSIAAALAFLVAYVAVEYFLLLRRDGQTLGKGLLGLRVVDAGHGKLLSPMSAAARIATLMGPFMLAIVVFYIEDDDAAVEDGGPVSNALLLLWFGLLVVSLVLALIDRRRHRSVHDLASRTVVVRAQRRGVRFREDAKMLVPGRVSLDKRL